MPARRKARCKGRNLLEWCGAAGRAFAAADARGRDRLCRGQADKLDAPTDTPGLGAPGSCPGARHDLCWTIRIGHRSAPKVPAREVAPFLGPFRMPRGPQERSLTACAEHGCPARAGPRATGCKCPPSGVNTGVGPPVQAGTDLALAPWQRGPSPAPRPHGPVFRPARGWAGLGIALRCGALAQRSGGAFGAVQAAKGRSGGAGRSVAGRSGAGVRSSCASVRKRATSCASPSA